MAVNLQTVKKEQESERVHHKLLAKDNFDGCLPIEVLFFPSSLCFEFSLEILATCSQVQVRVQASELEAKVLLRRLCNEKVAKRVRVAFSAHTCRLFLNRHLSLALFHT